MSPTATAHDVNCPRKTAEHSDPAKRVSDTYNLHLIGSGHQAIRKWIAVRLSDGSSDDVLYDDRRSAVVHQHHNEQVYAFICIGPASMSPCEAEAFLAINRALYDKGMRMTDPDHHAGGRQVIPRLTVEDQRASIRSITRGTRPTNLLTGRSL